MREVVFCKMVVSKHDRWKMCPLRFARILADQPRANRRSTPKTVTGVTVRREKAWGNSRTELLHRRSPLRSPTGGIKREIEYFRQLRRQAGGSSASKCWLTRLRLFRQIFATGKIGVLLKNARNSRRQLLVPLSAIRPTEMDPKDMSNTVALRTKWLPTLPPTSSPTEPSCGNGANRVRSKSSQTPRG
jgi:hypothetical protein